MLALAVFIVALLASAAGAASAPTGGRSVTATDPIVGVWTSAKGFAVDVEPSGSGFTGTVLRTALLAGSPCLTQVGTQVWANITRQADGTYTGTDHGWIWITGGDASTCRDNPSGARWTLGAVSNGTLSMVATFSNSAFATTTYTRPYSTPAPTPTTTITTPNPTPAPKHVGTLNATITGKGGITGALKCPGTCTTTFPIPVRSSGATRLTLHANPAPGYRFTGWIGGVCTPPVIATAYGWSATRYETCKLEIDRNYNTYLTVSDGDNIGYPNAAGVIKVTARFVKSH